MAVQRIVIDGKPVLIEVTPAKAGDELELPAASGRGSRGGVKMRQVSTKGGSRLEVPAEVLQNTVGALLEPVSRALQAAGPDEWTVELTLGFKGGAGIPFVASGEANGSVKVSAKWKKSDKPAVAPGNPGAQG